MEEATKKSLDLLERSTLFMQDFINKHGPAAWDTYVLVTQIGIIQCLITAAVICGALAYVCYKHSKWMHSDPEWREMGRWEDAEYGAPMGVNYFTRAIILFVLAINFANPWNYIAFTHPHVYVAYEVINKIKK